MTDARVTVCLEAVLKASSIEGLRLIPASLSTHLSIPRAQARNALRRAARKGLLAKGRTL